MSFLISSFGYNLYNSKFQPMAISMIAVLHVVCVSASVCVCVCGAVPVCSVNQSFPSCMWIVGDGASSSRFHI